MQGSALEGRDKLIKRTREGQGRLPGETEGLGYLGHLDSQISSIGGMSDREEK